jgi:hypothetical protein
MKFLLLKTHYMNFTIGFVLPDFMLQDLDF